MENSEETRERIIATSTSWLLEMELVDSPQLKDFLILNIYNSSPFISDVELLVDTNLKVGLIFLNLSFWGRVFKRQKSITNYLLRELSKVLPSFSFRIVFEKRILELALKKIEQTKGVNP